MGSSSVPSNTTQTTMLDPTRQKGLQQALGYLDKWTQAAQADPVYRGQRVAALPQEWYTARNMATRMGNRLAEGGITSVRRFADGGDAAFDPSGYQTVQYGGDNWYWNPTSNDWLDQSQWSAANTPVANTSPAVNTPAATTSTYGPMPTSSTASTPAATTSTYGPMPTSSTVSTPAATTATTNPPVTGVNAGWTYDAGNGLYTNSLTGAQTTNAPTGFTLTTTNPNASALASGLANAVSGLDTSKLAAATTGTTGTTTPTTTTATTAPATFGYTPTDLGAYSVYKQAEDLQKQAITAANSSIGLTPAPISSNYQAGTYAAPTVTADQVKAEKMATPDTWNEAFMRQYMSPYTQGVVDIAKREADRQYQQQLQQQKSQATASGAFGGYRQGVVEAEGARNQAQLLNDIQTKGMQDAYARAVEQFNADRQALMASGQFNATQANQIALSNVQNKLAADQSTAQYGLAGFQANEAAKQAQNQASMEAQKQSVANALSAENLDLAAVQQAMAGAQGLGALETQYQNAGLNSARLQADIAATKQAYDQSVLNANLAATQEQRDFWQKVADRYAAVVGTMPGGSVSVTQKV